MEKKNDKRKKCLASTKKHRISRNLLLSYLLILFVPSIAIVAIYFTAQNALVETQVERMQNTLSETGLILDREVKQAQNAAYYVSREKRLCDYLYQGIPSEKKDEFYSLYTIANNYPDYRLTNQVIKNVFILIANSQYILKLPQVIPQTEQGIATLEGFTFASYEEFMEYYSLQDKSQMVFDYETESGENLLFMPCQISYPYVNPGKSVVVVQLDWSQILKIIEPVLSGKEGTVAIIDREGQIVEYCQNAGRGGASGQIEEETWEAFLSSSGESLTVFSQNLGFNGWKLAAAVPKSVLTEGIGMIRYAVVALCVLSILVGIFICLTYWYQRKNMVQEYFSLQEKINCNQETGKVKKDDEWFWRSFGHFLMNVDMLQTTVNRLQITVDSQKNVIREEFLRKLLYGDYDSEEQVLEAAGNVGIELTDLNYYVVDMELEDPSKAGIGCSREEFAKMLETHIEEHLPWDYWMYKISELSYILIIYDSREIPFEELKNALEQMNYEFYRIYKVQSYTGISCMAKEPLEISRMFEIASRISEVARYRGIRVPMLPTEMPKDLMNQPLFLTIDMELKLLSQIQSGTMEQLEEFLSQIKDVYFRSGNSRYTYGHTIEILRSAIYRSIPSGMNEQEAEKLCEKAQNARSAEEIFELIRRTKQYCLLREGKEEESGSDLDREKVSSYIEEHFCDPCLNLSMLAEWLGEAERKLYNDFKLCFGISFSSYLEQRRMQYACDLLKKGMAVKETAEKVGYGSDYSFRRAFKRVVGIPPSDFRKMQTN